MMEKQNKCLVAIIASFIVSIGLIYPAFVEAEDASVQSLDSQALDSKDPYESFNRLMFNFNEKFDSWILKPVALFYNKVMPEPLRKGINNFFNNVNNIPTIANDLLQGHFYQATSDTWRLAINSTVGVLGLMDVASPLGLLSNNQDLGLTFAHWGYIHSNYLVLPFIGPMTVRDALAWPVNYQYLTLYPYIEPVSTRYEIYGFGVVAKRAELLRFQSVMEKAALDKYVFVRDAYLQRRDYLIEQNKERDQSLGAVSP